MLPVVVFFIRLTKKNNLAFQAETEELALKVESLNAENSNLRSEISRLTENSEKLRLENSALMVPSCSASNFGFNCCKSFLILSKSDIVGEYQNFDATALMIGVLLCPTMLDGYVNIIDYL